MSQAITRENSLSRWANEGGAVPVGISDLAAPAHPRCMPQLPAGSVAQPTASYKDRTGKLLYEFNRVSQAVKMEVDGRSLTVNRLEPDLSYWVVNWAERAPSGDEYPAGRWLTFAQARKRAGGDLSFKAFSELHEGLEALLPAERELAS